MNEEERWALEYFKSVKVGDNFDIQKELKCREVISGLLLKQQKEINTLKESQFVIYDEDGNIAGCIKLGNDVVSKDKIKAKAEELDNQQRQWREDRTNKHTDAQIIYARDVLEELLGE